LLLSYCVWFLGEAMQQQNFVLGSSGTVATRPQRPLLLPGVAARSPDNNVLCPLPPPPCWAVPPAGSPMSVCTPMDAACTAWRRLNCPGAPSRRNSMSLPSSDSTPASVGAGAESCALLRVCRRDSGPLMTVPPLAGSPMSVCTPHDAACTAWRCLDCPGAPSRRNSMPLPSSDSTPTSSRAGAAARTLGVPWLPQSARTSPRLSMAAPTPVHLWASAMTGASPKTLSPVSRASSCGGATPGGGGALLAPEPRRPTQLLGLLDLHWTTGPSNASSCWSSRCSTPAGSELVIKKHQAEDAKAHDTGVVVGDGKTPSAWLRELGA